MSPFICPIIKKNLVIGFINPIQINCETTEAMTIIPNRSIITELFDLSLNKSNNMGHNPNLLFLSIETLNK